MTDEQLAFDIEAMLHESAVEAAPGWSGAPLGFTAAYWPAVDLEAAHEHWQFLHKLDQSRTQSRMWHRAIAVPGSVAVGEHGFDLFTARPALRALDAWRGARWVPVRRRPDLPSDLRAGRLACDRG